VASREKEKHKRYWSRIEEVVDERIRENPDFYDDKKLERIQSIIATGKVWLNSSTLRTSCINELLHKPMQEFEWKRRRCCGLYSADCDCRERERRKKILDRFFEGWEEDDEWPCHGGWCRENIITKSDAWVLKNTVVCYECHQAWVAQEREKKRRSEKKIPVILNKLREICLNQGFALSKQIADQTTYTGGEVGQALRKLANDGKVKRVETKPGRPQVWTVIEE
jgi:hypothetical protein